MQERATAGVQQRAGHAVHLHPSAGVPQCASPKLRARAAGVLPERAASELRQRAARALRVFSARAVPEYSTQSVCRRATSGNSETPIFINPFA